MNKQPQTRAAQQRRDRLAEALLELMESKGYAQTTVTDLCRAAQIPRRTFYHYFDCKEAVLNAVVEDMIYACNLETMFEFHAGFEAMKESLVRNFRFWQGPARRRLELLLDNGLSGEMIRCALRWQAAEHIDLPRRPELTPKRLEIAQMVGIYSFFSLLTYWRGNEYRETPEEMAEYAAWFLSEPLYRP